MNWKKSERMIPHEKVRNVPLCAPHRGDFGGRLFPRLSTSTPAWSRSPPPTVDTVTDANGNEVSAIIRDQDGNEVHGVASGDITVTPVSALEQAAADISEMLSNAYEQIQQANTIADLVPTIGDFLQTIGSAAQVADLVVRDVFDVSPDRHRRRVPGPGGQQHHFAL